MARLIMPINPFGYQRAGVVERLLHAGECRLRRASGKLPRRVEDVAAIGIIAEIVGELMARASSAGEGPAALIYGHRETFGAVLAAAGIEKELTGDPVTQAFLQSHGDALPGGVKVRAGGCRTKILASLPRALSRWPKRLRWKNFKSSFPTIPTPPLAGNESGLTHADTVNATEDLSDGDEVTVIESLMPLKSRALPNLPAAKSCPNVFPWLPFPDRSSK